MIGGSYLAASPQISYRRLLEGLNARNFAVHAWSYIPSFDHQGQANEAWKDFRLCKKKLESRVNQTVQPIRLGHSLGCKLHLLAPDGGRNSKGLITLSFNNFAASQSVPMLSKVTNKFGNYSEFSPSPKETLNLILNGYIQQNNLLIKFDKDKLDQSFELSRYLKKRVYDLTNNLQLKGNHLTPASAGLRKSLLGNWADNGSKVEDLNILLEVIYQWSNTKLLP